MTKKNQAIVTPDFVSEALKAVESGDFETYDIKSLVQHFCWMAKFDGGALLGLQQLVSALLEKSYTGEIKAQKAFGFKINSGRKTIGYDRDENICVFIAEKIAHGSNLTNAKKDAEKKFNLGNSSINNIWQKGKNMGFALFLSVRRERGQSVSEYEFAQILEYVSKGVKDHLNSSKIYKK